jgi:hypothetical protein
MQEPIRYYITKSGEEPTVRSVKVAQRPPERDDNGATSADAAAEPKAPTPTPARTVERLVKSAIRGRSAEA